MRAKVVDTETKALVEECQVRDSQGKVRFLAVHWFTVERVELTARRKRWRSHGVSGDLAGRVQFLGLVTGFTSIGDLAETILSQIQGER